MRVVRSNHAHGRIVSIDTSAAKALPGVVDVWTADDIPEIGPIDFREGTIEKLAPYRQPVLAVGKVRYVGDPVAAVFAEDPYIAEDAADLVEVTIEELPPILDARDPLGEFSPGKQTEAAFLTQGYGDVDAVFKTAPHIVELKLTSGRHSGVPLETRGAIGRYDASRDVLELHGAAKVPHRNKDLIARMLKRPPSSVNCYESHVGGGFGIRGEIYPEDILVCAAAIRLERPVKWIEDRREHLIAANHSRNQHHHIKAACTDNGEILAIDDVVHHDNGAYVRTHATRVAMMTCGVLPGPYRVPGAYRAVCHFRLTNKTPAATYRSPGRFESTFVHERVMDAIAAKLGVDPIEIRRRNLVPHAQMPYQRPMSGLGAPVVLDLLRTDLRQQVLDKAAVVDGWMAAGRMARVDSVHLFFSIWATTQTYADFDVQIRAVPPPEMVANLRADNIDGFLAPDNIVQRAVFDGVGFIHILSKDIWDGHPCCAFAASKEFVTSSPNTYAALLKAIVDATAFATKAENRKQIAEAIAPANYINQPVTVLEQILTGTFADGLGSVQRVPNRVDFDPFPWESFAIWIMTQMKRWGQIKGDVDYAGVAKQVYLATDTTKLMKEVGLTPPTSTSKSFSVMGKAFDPSKPEDYIKIGRAHV